MYSYDIDNITQFTARKVQEFVVMRVQSLNMLYSIMLHIFARTV